MTEPRPLEAARAAAEEHRRVVDARPPAGARASLVHRLGRAAVFPLADEQQRFNDAVLRLVDALSERLDGVAGRSAERERRLTELEERLLRVERRSAAAPGSSTVAAQPRADALPDYFAFESRMRGPVEEVRARQEAYVADLRGHAPVLDLGCGRGELLALLREAGVEARGVDADADMVAYARGEGLEVEQGDVLEHLAGLADGSLGAIFAGQLLEHLPPAALVRLLSLGAAKLRPGGLFVAETINPVSPLALRNYFADLTHAQPLVPETLELLARGAGFRSTELRFLNEPRPGERLRPVELPDDAAFDPARAALAANVRLLDELLFAPLDYALLARR